MICMKTTLIGTTAGAVIAAVLTWYTVSDNLNTKHALELSKRDQAYAEAVQIETNRVLELERSLTSITSEILLRRMNKRGES